ncbi:MAG TPA: ABC transporter permease, partial [Anaerolineae bacterium]
VPLLTVAFMRLVGSTLGRAGLMRRMAARTVMQALSRTSVAIAALMVAISVVIGVTVMIASFRSTVENWLDQTLTADLYVSPPLQGASRSASIDPVLIAKITALPGIASTQLIRNTTVHSHEYGDVRMVAPTTLGNRVLKSNGSSSRSADIQTQLQDGAVIVSEPFANRHHLQPDARITLDTDHGPREFPIVGVYYDYSSDQGIILMLLPTYRQYWDDTTVSAIAAYVSPDANENRVEDALRVALGGACDAPTRAAEQVAPPGSAHDCAPVLVQSNKSLRDAALVIFDRTFAITLALRFIALVVAFIGVLGALMALQLERTRELGTLRATGMTLPQLWRLTLLESGLMGATAGLLSIPTGLILSWVLIYVINLRSFGWTIFFEPVPQVYLEALALSVIAALLAAVYPMLRLGRLQVADALREE